ncbi:uncharacterized protein LOC117571688 isoform X1 [Drosophila albomicans]|uniref:Uncharacterized protein LOC117571688 isoform X1 n=1 Tax=Drosophila albomicans TaxID=7291 RepID=A0A6P8XB40_DROAB|nr:uncharacterized protein LOC117571688 isoform X1 [Drosophila albomicans]
MKLILCLLLLCSASGAIGARGSSASITAAQRAEIAKLRGELNEAFEAGEEEQQQGVIVQPAWTQKGHGARVGDTVPSKVIVNATTVSAAQALRSEITQAVAQQGQSETVRELDAHFQKKAAAAAQLQSGQAVGSTHDEQLGGSSDDEQANVVDAAPLDIDLAQLQQLQLSKRRSREMLLLSRIVEDLQFGLGENVTNWLQLQHNGTIYLVGQRPEDLIVLQQQEQQTNLGFHSFEVFQTLSVPSPIDALISIQQAESLLLLATQQQLLWYRLEPETGLQQFWTWPLGQTVSRLLSFVLDNREHLLVVSGNRTISIYAHDVQRLEFWIAQRLQLEQAITALAVLDTGLELLLAVGQTNKALIYAHNAEQGLQLKLRQRLEAPQIMDIAAFQMGGRSYLALGGQQPQILAYVQGQLLPKTVLGQNFGIVELFLPVPVRSYRDDLLLIVQHRVHFDTHSLLQLEVLVWNGEVFEASLPPPCELGAETRYGAACMLDELREKGLAGAALQRQQGSDAPLLLVPRLAAPSGHFRLHTELLPRNSELQDLQEIEQFMRSWVEEQDSVLQLAEQLLHDEAESLAELLDTSLLINEGAQIDALYVNNVPWTTADAGVDLLELLQQLRLLDAAASERGKRSRRQTQLFSYDYEQLDFDVVEVEEEVLIDRVNHVPFYIQNATLQFNGTINVQQLQLLQPQVNEQETLESLPSSTRQQLQLSGDLIFDTINGVNWEELLRQLVWRTKPLQLSQLQVQGAVVFEDSLHLSALNELSFPGDYLWSQSSSTSIVRAPKHFTQTLTVNDVDTAGSINGRNPLDAITLSDAQDWPGWVTFTQLEVSEELRVRGSAQGRQLEQQAPANPTLLESQNIQAACHFAQLIVHGPLIVQGQFDGKDYDALLGDLAQRPNDANEELIIPGQKHVQQLVLPVDTHVLDGQLSGIPIEQFVTKHTPQLLQHLQQLEGYVYFNQLHLNGSFDGVQLQQLLAQALLVNDTLLAPSTHLRFEQELELPQLRVTRNLNEQPISGYQTLHEPMHLDTATFEQLQAEQLDVTGNVEGVARLNGKALDELLSAARQADHVQVQDLILPNGVQAAKLQGLQAEHLLGFLQQSDVLPLLILQGQLQVQHIAVSGAVQVMETLNGRQLEQLQREVVWLDQPNELRTRWRFQQSPIFASDLLLQGSYNQRLLPELLEDIVFRSDQELQIVGTKHFAGHVTVQDELRLVALNGVPFERFATKQQPLIFAGDVHLIDGELHVLHLQLEKELNGRPAEQLEQRLMWLPEMQVFLQRGLVHLPQQLQLQDLTVLGHLGDRNHETLTEFFDDVLDKRAEQLQVEGSKVFTGRVCIQQGAYINELNGLKLKQLLEQLIMLDERNVVTLHSPVRFEAPVEMQQLLADQLILQGELLNGCNVTEWLHDTIRVDRDWQTESSVRFAAGALDNNSLHVEQLNHLNLSRVVTLHTVQELSFPQLMLQELHLNDGHVLLPQGLVNGRNLSEEYDNTLLVNAPYVQLVQTPLVLPSLIVLDSLIAHASINGDVNYNLSDVATLHEEQLQLQTPLYFELLHAPEVRTQFLINGFDYGAWHEKSLWAQGRQMQVISGNWSVYWLRVKQPQAAEQAAHAVYRRQATAMAQRQRELCQRLAKLFGMLRLPYVVKQLRHSFELHQSEEQADLRRVFAVKSPLMRSNYLLLNELGCWTRIYRWNGTHFQQAGAFESGPIDEVTVLQLRNATADEQFSFMTSYELSDEHAERSWNCSSLQNLQSWRTAGDALPEIEPLGLPEQTLAHVQQQHEAKQLLKQRRVPSYQQAIKYLHRPSIESQLRSQSETSFDAEQYEALRERLLEQLSFRLQTEVNITQLSIPESDLYDDEHLVEDFLWLMRQLQRSRTRSTMFATLATDTLPLPNNPARVLAARSCLLIWPVLEELRTLQRRLDNATVEDEEARQLLLQMEQAVHDILQLAYADGNWENSQEDDDTLRLHAVIERLRQLQQQLLDQQQQQPLAEASIVYTKSLAAPHQQQQHWHPVETIRLHVGPAHRGKLLYARLTIVAPDAPSVAPSTAPAAHIQLHHANGTLFQSLAANPQARQLTALRVLDETLLAFVEGCCRVRVFIYRGVQGFVPFVDFQTEAEVLQLLAMRLPLLQAPGALYTLAVVQSRRIIFHELVIPGLFETWLHC